MSIEGEVLSFKNYLEERKNQIRQKLSIYYGFLNGVYPSEMVCFSSNDLFDELNSIYKCEERLEYPDVNLCKLESYLQEEIQSNNEKVKDMQLKYQLGLIQAYNHVDNKTLVKSKNI